MSMIINGASYRCSWWWAKHFGDEEENLRTTVVQSNGLVADNVQDMMREMEAMALASGTGAKNFMWICDISPAPDKVVTEEQRDRMREIIEEQRGLKGEVYFMIEQEKADGRKHFHLVELRIDLESGKAIPDHKDAQICHAASRRICEEMGWERNISPFDKDREGPSPERAPDRWEMYRGMKSGIDPRDVQAEVTELFRQSDSGKAFKAALEDHGYELAVGRRGLLILDAAGHEHSLARRIEGLTARELNGFMKDVDREALPSVEQAKAAFQERKVAALEADHATVKSEIEWQEALAKAAIEKEKIEGRFLAPEEGQQKGPGAGEAGQGGREKEEARKEQSMPGNLRGPGAEIWTAMQRSDSAQAFASALQEKNIHLAAVTGEEAYRSQITAAYPKAIGNFATEYRAGEIVAVTEAGQVYRLNRRTTGLERDQLEAFLAPIARGQLEGIEATRERQQQRLNEEQWPVQAPEPVSQPHLFGLELKPPHETPAAPVFEQAARKMMEPGPAPDAPAQLKGVAREIWEARQESHNAEAFEGALRERDMMLARVTKDEARDSEIDHFYGGRDAKYSPRLGEGEYVVVTESGQVYQLNQRTGRDRPRDWESFFSKLDPENVQTATEAKEILQQAGEERELERAAFRELAALGGPKEGISTRELGQAALDANQELGDVLHAGGAAAEHSVQMISRSAEFAGKALESVASIAGEAIEMFGDMFGATALTPERIRAAIEAHESAAEERSEDLVRMARADATERQQAAGREQQKIAEEQRRYYEEQQEREMER